MSQLKNSPNDGSQDNSITHLFIKYEAKAIRDREPERLIVEDKLNQVEYLSKLDLKSIYSYYESVILEHHLKLSEL